MAQRETETKTESKVVEQSAGSPAIQGATWDGKGTNFALFSENAEGVELCLFNRSEDKAESQRSNMLEELLAALEKEIDLNRAQHASADVMLALEGFRARLESLIEAEKNRPD